MPLRTATPDDAAAVLAIYAPIVETTAISFELAPPDVLDMGRRIASTLERLPWLVSTGNDGAVDGYAYASRHRERAAYQWSVEVTVYVARQARGGGVGRRLYTALLGELAALGYTQALAIIALPNAASIGLHEAVGFVHAATFRQVGFKLGRWHDIGWWQRPLQPAPPADPQPPRAFVPQASGDTPISQT